MRNLLILMVVTLLLSVLYGCFGLGFDDPLKERVVQELREKLRVGEGGDDVKLLLRHFSQRYEFVRYRVDADQRHIHCGVRNVRSNGVSDTSVTIDISLDANHKVSGIKFAEQYNAL